MWNEEVKGKRRLEVKGEEPVREQYSLLSEYEIEWCDDDEQRDTLEDCDFFISGTRKQEILKADLLYFSFCQQIL